MDNDRFNPNRAHSESTPEPALNRGKDPFLEPPIKDYSHLLRGERPTPPSRRSRPIRKILIALVILLILAAAGWGGYSKLLTHAKSGKATHSTTQAKNQPLSVPATVATTAYTSLNFKVSLKYPVAWKVASDTSSALTILSPPGQITNASGQAVSAKIIMMIVPQAQLPKSLGNSDASAVLASQQISYANPTSNQRAQTYLSFVQYSTTTTPGGLDGIYVSGNYGYQKGQTIARTDLASLNPLVNVTFGQCSGSNCTNLDNLTIASKDWNDQSFAQPILSLLQSLSFQ